jgi:hypothetical protein
MTLVLPQDGDSLSNGKAWGQPIRTAFTILDVSGIRCLVGSLFETSSVETLLCGLRLMAPSNPNWLWDATTLTISMMCTTSMDKGHVFVAGGLAAHNMKALI